MRVARVLALHEDAVTEQFFHLRIHQHDLSALIHNDDRVWRGLQQSAKLGLGAPLLRHVDPRRDDVRPHVPAAIIAHALGASLSIHSVVRIGWPVSRSVPNDAQ